MLTELLLLPLLLSLLQHAGMLRPTPLLVVLLNCTDEVSVRLSWPLQAAAEARTMSPRDASSLAAISRL